MYLFRTDENIYLNAKKCSFIKSIFSNCRPGELFGQNTEYSIGNFKVLKTNWGKFCLSFSLAPG